MLSRSPAIFEAMATLNVAVVSRDPVVRLAAARAFDDAPPSWAVHLHDTRPPEADVVVFGTDVEREAKDGIVFDPSDAGRVVDAVKRSMSSARTKTFAVVGAGRGVGVTSLALHLSAAAARTHETCFVDLDLEWGAAARLGMPEDHLSWYGAAGDRDPRLAGLPVTGGFRALLAPTTGSSPPGEEDVKATVRGASGSFDRVFVDCADGPCLDAFVDLVDACVLVVPASPAGARRAVRILNSFETARWAIVLNRLGPGGETTRTELHRLLGRRSAVELPCAPALRDSEDDDELLSTPWSRYVRAVQRLLHALETA